MTVIRQSLTCLIIFTLGLVTSFAASKNGFVLDDALVPETQILRGGPPRDGIPAIHNPVFIDSTDANFLNNNDRILGIEMDGTAKAYPVAILNWHEVVNDTFNMTTVAVTYCPLCGTGVAFRGTEQKDGITFGVSGLLYNSDVLLYDLESQSLWSQLMGQAISGKRRGERLVKVPAQHTTWQDWHQQYPDTLVLSTETGYNRDYNRNPYGDYDRSEQVFFPVSITAPSSYHPKEQVIGLEYGQETIAFPYAELNKVQNPVIEGKINGRAYKLVWNKDHQSGQVFDGNGNPLPVTRAFWFAWYTFHPETLVYSAQNNGTLAF